MRDIKKQFKRLKKVQPTDQWQVSQWESLRATISQNHEVKQLTFLQKFNTVMSNPSVFRPVGNLVAIVLVAVVGSWGMIASAENTAHGDLLYPVKKVMEKVSLAITVDDNARIEKQTELVSKRLFELNNLAIRLEYSNVPERSLDRTVDELKKEIEAVHAGLQQVKETGNADQILAVTTHVEEQTNELAAKIAKTAEQLPADVSFSMDELLHEAEVLAEDTNKQLLSVIVSEDLSDGAISQRDIEKRLHVRLDQVEAEFSAYDQTLIVWKSTNQDNNEEAIATVEALELEITTTLENADAKFVDKDYVGILAAADQVEYLLAQIDNAMNPVVELDEDVKGVEEVSSSTEESINE